ncbi:hypothetical protein M0R04_08225 [Candidatus Dojkabacteria bacterium]|jgi:hypothetical protein|nr:hypothetical protein [Candidatus Dojkabacteria bacterium]
MGWGTILVSIALVSGLYIGIPYIVTGTASSDTWVKNGIPMIAAGILALILAQGIFGKK